MSERKRDNKGRLLRSGERQRIDGRYEYRYIDNDGQTHSVYSWRLVSTDKDPKGKRSKEALRDMIKVIERELDDNVNIGVSRNITVNECFDRYIDLKHEIKNITKVGYRYAYNKFMRNGLGKKSVYSIKYSDVKKLYLQIMEQNGLKPWSLTHLNSALLLVFHAAVRDNYIRINPVSGVFAEICRNSNVKSEKRHALTEKQQEIFVDYITDSKKYIFWKPIITFLLGTGCRIGEAVSVRWEDCDFDKNLISINHSFGYGRVESENRCVYYISTPKTKSGTRVIPMLSDVREMLLKEQERQIRTGRINNCIIDGYSGFVFMNKRCGMVTISTLNRILRLITDEYNAGEIECAQIEQREPMLLPNISCHILRHTFCTRFCENETNLKVIQEIMGHSNISVTMDIYNEATLQKKTDSFANLEGKIKIS